VRDGRITGQRGWIVDKPEPLDVHGIYTQLIQEIYSGDADIPPEVVVGALPADAASLEEWLRGVRGSRVRIKIAERGQKSELAETGAGNAAEVLRLHRMTRAQDLNARSTALRALQDAIGMDTAPLRIECYDVSHTQGTNAVASMVVFEDGMARKKEYRQFAIADAADDLSSMRETLRRRFKRYLEEQTLPLEEREQARFAYPPQLVVVDGGAPQVTAAKAVLDEMGITDVALIGLAKRLEEVWLPGETFPVILPRGSEAMYLLQRVRDEAHRFAIRHHRAKRTRAMTQTELDTIPGVGPTRAKALIRHFGSLKRLREASVDQIALVPGVGNDMARVIHAALAVPGGMLES